LDNKSSEKTALVGHQIRASKVMVVDADGTNIGVISTGEALRMAEESGLDLVQVSGGGKDRAPTCKIMNYSKFKYEASKKQKAAVKKQRENEIKTKEIKFRPTTDINDLQVKAKHAEEFLNEGFRLRVACVFKGRENSHQSVGAETFNKFLNLITNAQYLSNPTMESREMSVILVKKES
jgi:translation initiation factor IF-3